jgi:hypothetical protein
LWYNPRFFETNKNKGGYKMVELVRVDGWREYIVKVEEPKWEEIDKHRKEKLYFVYV